MISYQWLMRFFMRHQLMIVLHILFEKWNWKNKWFLLSILILHSINWGLRFIPHYNKQCFLSFFSLINFRTIIRIFIFIFSENDNERRHENQISQPMPDLRHRGDLNYYIRKSKGVERKQTWQGYEHE